MISLKAGCKVNLGLKITDLRADGYHELDSLFCPLDEPYDCLEICEKEDNTEPGLTVICNDSSLDAEHNTLTRCYQLLGAELGLNRLPSLEVRLTKGIPAGSGLGGGSSDAAVLLNYLNAKLGHKKLERDALLKVAAKIGADVPFFLTATPARVRGIGEIIIPVSLDLSRYTLLLIIPQTQVQTKWAYKAYDDLAAACAKLSVEDVVARHTK